MTVWCCFQQGDELVHLRRIEVEARGALARLDEARGSARLFHVGPEIEEDEVHVLNFVGAVAHELGGGHAGWDVSADAQAALVRFIDDDWHKLRLYRAVDLDLHIAEVGVVIDAGAGFFGRGGQDFDGAFVRAGAIDEVRPAPCAGRSARPLRYVYLSLPSSSMELPRSRDRGDAGGNIEEGVVGARDAGACPTGPGSSILPVPSMTCAPGARRLTALGLNTDDALAVHGDTLRGHGLRRRRNRRQ